MIEALKPYADYNESSTSVLPHLQKSAQSVDDFSQDNQRVSASSAQSVFSRIYSLIDEDTNPLISHIRADLSREGQT